MLPATNTEKNTESKIFPKYNFIGGHNDPQSIPVEGLIEATARVLRRRGQTIATYNQDCGPLGDIEMREFLSEKLAKFRGMSVTTEDILVTSGSGQALDLINDILMTAIKGLFIILKKAILFLFDLFY